MGCVKVGASIPKMIRQGRMGIDECREQWQADHIEEPVAFWTSGMITAAIISLCLFSYGIGMWHGQMQGMKIAAAMQTLERPE